MQIIFTAIEKQAERRFVELIEERDDPDEFCTEELFQVIGEFPGLTSDFWNVLRLKHDG